MAQAAATYDVAVIGAGVVGSAIARELARYQLTCVLLEAGPDVGAGTSKANTALLHTGFDAKPGTLEARLVRRGYQLLVNYSATVGIPLQRVGALLVAWTPEQAAALPTIQAQAERNGYHQLRPVSVDELYQLEPRLGPDATGALAVPGESIICPWTTPLAFATEAVTNGVQLRLQTPVRAIWTQPDGTHELDTPSGPIRAWWVINAAGLCADEVDRMFGHHGFTVTPRRGELVVFDKLARPLVSHILLPVPTAKTKGVLITPTVYGNLLLGPTAEDLPDKTDTASTAAGLAGLLEHGRRILPELLDEEVTAVYAGLRAATEHGDYQLAVHGAQHYACVGGIRSTGLSSSMAIAEHLVALLADAGLPLAPKAQLRPIRMPYIGEAASRPYQSPQAIAANPDYGRVVCYCERVTRGELLDASSSVIPARDLDGLRRRTRALLGRCQGFYCMAAVAALLAEATGRPVADLLALEGR